MIGNTVLLFKFLLKLWPFLREVFFRNKDFQLAVRSNKSIVTLLASSLVLLLLTIGNARTAEEYARLYDRLLRESRETTAKYEQLITDHAVLVGKYETNRGEAHQLEIDLAISRATQTSLEQRLADVQANLDYERTHKPGRK
jgi:hypothetical protein